MIFISTSHSWNTANKIGTFMVSVVRKLSCTLLYCQALHLPDFEMETGGEIEIEERR